MAVILHMVTKNEEYRYLDACLTHVLPMVDGAFVYDDQSTDETVEILRAHGVDHAVRPDVVPSFAEEEGTCRYTGWMTMLAALPLTSADWVLAIDADEFPVGDLRKAITIVHGGGWLGAQIRIHEMWNVDPLMRRVDRFWGDISGLRLVNLQPTDHMFRMPGMGAGSVPGYAFREPYSVEWGLPFEILHLGYAEEEDRLRKHEFYTQKTKNGHNSAHVQSIIEQPHLSTWKGVQPAIWRGVNEQ